MFKPDEKVMNAIPDKDVAKYLDEMVRDLFERMDDGGFVKFVMEKGETEPEKNCYKNRTFQFYRIVTRPDTFPYKSSMKIIFNIIG